MIILPTILLLSLRYGIGGDYFNYSFFYESLLESGESQFEPLTELLMLFIGKVFHSYEFFVAVTAIITYVSFFAWVIKHSEANYLWLTISIFLCFYFAHSMNTIVQILATSVAIWAYDAIQERKFIRFSVIVIIAALIHSSAIFIIPLFFIQLIQFKKADEENRNYKKSIFKILAVAAVCAICAFLYLLLAGKFGWLYSKYIGDHSEGGYIIVYIKLGILFYIPELMFMPSLVKENEKYELPYIMIFIEMTSFVLTLFAAYAFRVAYYFSFAHCIIIPAVIEKFPGKSKWMAKLYIIAVLIFYFYFTTFICQYNNIDKYQSLFMR